MAACSLSPLEDFVFGVVFWLERLAEGGGAVLRSTMLSGSFILSLADARPQGRCGDRHSSSFVSWVSGLAVWAADPMIWLIGLVWISERRLLRRCRIHCWSGFSYFGASRALKTNEASIWNMYVSRFWWFMTRPVRLVIQWSVKRAFVQHAIWKCRWLKNRKPANSAQVQMSAHEVRIWLFFPLFVGLRKSRTLQREAVSASTRQKKNSLTRSIQVRFRYRPVPFLRVTT
jgi:hypothetical protein